jgi:hypothetical protein
MSKSECILELFYRDISGTKLEHFKINQSDDLMQSKMIKIFQNKYGLFRKVTVNQQDIIESKDDFFEY